VGFCLKAIRTGAEVYFGRILFRSVLSVDPAAVARTYTDRFAYLIGVFL
jgi:hypothetical protein